MGHCKTVVGVYGKKGIANKTRLGQRCLLSSGTLLFHMVYSHHVALLSFKTELV